MPTILDYIHEITPICQNIVQSRKNIFASSLALLNQYQPSEIIIIGSGTSCFAGMSAKAFIEKTCQVKVSALFPNQFIEQTPALHKGSLVIGISQSGKSFSTIEALKHAQHKGAMTLAITAFKDSPIAQVAHHSIEMLVGEELAVAKTKGYQASVLTLWVMALEYALHKGLITLNEYDAFVANLTQVIQEIPSVIQASETWYAHIASDLVKAQKIILVGVANDLGNLSEAHLKLLETIREHVLAFELEEFMHGIYNLITSDTYLIYINSSHKYAERMHKLRDYLSLTSPYQYRLNFNDVQTSIQDVSLTTLEESDFSSLYTIVPIQVLCHYWPISKGIDPSKPRDPNFHKSLGSKF